MVLTSKAEPKMLDLDGDVNYIDFGGDGPAMALVHGLGGSLQNWFAVGPALAERYRVLALDLAGFGRTPLIQGRSARVHDNRLLLDRFLDRAVGAPSILVGNSMGGLITILEAAAEPEKVSALVLVDPAAPYPEGTEVDPVVATTFGAYLMENAEDLITAYMAQAGPEATARTTLELCCVDADRVSPDIVKAQVDLLRDRMGMEWASRALVEAARSILELNENEDEYFTAVRGVKAPTLLVQGQEDRLVPLAAAQQLANMRPDWAFEVFDDTGHVPQLEAPERFLATVGSWLSTALPRVVASGPNRPATTHSAGG